jgi:hypothetical protein
MAAIILKHRIIFLEIGNVTKGKRKPTVTLALCNKNRLVVIP